MQNFKYVGGFIQIPKILFTDKKYKSLPSESKLVYGLLLDRTSLSESNGWIDKDGRVFVYYSIKELSEILGFGRDKIIKLLRILEESGLLTRYRKGINKPWSIVINRVGISDFTKSENTTYGSRKNRPYEVGKSDFNNTDNNNTEMSYTYSSSYEEAEEKIREQIEYESLCYTYNKAELDSVVTLMCDTLFVNSKNIELCGVSYSSSFVKNKLLSLNSEHIIYALEVMASSTEKITNVRKYMLSLLFNAPSTMESYFTNRVKTEYYN